MLSIKGIEARKKKNIVEGKGKMGKTEPAKMKDLKHYERLKQSILFESQRTPDIIFVTKEGQSVPCHR